MEITVQQYKDALIKVSEKITLNQIKLLQLQYNLPAYKTTASQLASLLGRVRWTVINSWYGRLGHILSDELGILPLKHTKTGRYEWWRIISEGELTQQGFVWTLKPEFIQALEELQIVHKTSSKSRGSTDGTGSDAISDEIRHHINNLLPDKPAAPIDGGCLCQASCRTNGGCW